MAISSDNLSMNTNDSKENNKRFAVVFPGQGSQSVGMLSELASVYDEVADAFDEASNALEFDLWQICQNDELLAQTQYTQPALLTASIAIWRILEANYFAKVGHPLFLAGHSLGEYTAMCASGMLSLKDAVRLVYQRGAIMQDAVKGQECMMAAVLGLEDEQVVTICEQVEDLFDNAKVNAANFNSPGQVVIAGNKIGVEAVIQQVKTTMGKRSIPLKVSVPSHCSLMDDATKTLQQVLANIQVNSPCIPIIQNRHAKIEHSLVNMGQSLVEQLNNPVLWSDTMEQLAQRKIDTIIECGNGNVLSNLAKRQTTPIEAYPTDKLARLEKLFEKNL